MYCTVSFFWGGMWRERVRICKIRFRTTVHIVPFFLKNLAPQRRIEVMHAFRNFEIATTKSPIVQLWWLKSSIKHRRFSIAKFDLLVITTASAKTDRLLDGLMACCYSRRPSWYPLLILHSYWTWHIFIYYIDSLHIRTWFLIVIFSRGQPKTAFFHGEIMPPLASHSIRWFSALQWTQNGVTMSQPILPHGCVWK